jgi:putative ABC transport system ATP-binding protein
VAVVGPSGSGKSTLLGLIAGLDDPSSGRILIDGADITGLGEDALARLRGQKIGFVFQSFHLIPSLTALENILVPMEIAGRRDAAARAQTLLDEVGLQGRGHHYPSQLSGGEQQRVAIARALSNDPVIVLADEPTGNLDSANGRHIVDLLLSINRTRGTTVVLVTHDAELAALADARLVLRDGAVVSREVTQKMGSDPIFTLIVKLGSDPITCENPNALCSQHGAPGSPRGLETVALFFRLHRDRGGRDCCATVGHSECPRDHRRRSPDTPWCRRDDLDRSALDRGR